MSNTNVYFNGNDKKRNKYQEVLDWVSAGNDSCGTEWDLLQELVDKETPMKPLYIGITQT